MIYVLLFLILFTVIVIGAEFGAYAWHRFAHTDIAPPVRQTHRTHHLADLTHEAHEDFYWVILLLLIGLIPIIGIWYYEIVPIVYPIVVYLTVFLVFLWNWYIHSAYHIPNHWLNQYKWFKRDKRIHLQHHINPRSNYGIASHFNDIIFGTYEYPVHNPEKVFNKIRLVKSE